MAGTSNAIILYNEYNRTELLDLAPGRIDPGILHKTFHFSSFDNTVYLMTLDRQGILEPTADGYFYLKEGSRYLVCGRPSKHSFADGDPEV